MFTNTNMSGNEGYSMVAGYPWKAQWCCTACCAGNGLARAESTVYPVKRSLLPPRIPQRGQT